MTERYQWMRNHEGGQKFGNQQQIVRLDASVYNKHVSDKVGGIGFASYRAKYPEATHISLVSHDRGSAWQVGGIGNTAELRPAYQQWAKRVESFDSADAVALGLTADSQAGDQPVNPEYRSSTKKQPVNL